jgi:hypothetical protein
MNIEDNFSILGEGKYHHVKVIIEDKALSTGDFSFYGDLRYYWIQFELFSG